MHETVYESEGLGAAMLASAGDGVDGGRDGDAADCSLAADETACRNFSMASLAPGERGCIDGSSLSDGVAPSLSSSSFSTRPAFRKRDASSPMLRCLFHSSESSPKPPRRPIETISSTTFSSSRSRRVDSSSRCLSLSICASSSWSCASCCSSASLTPSRRLFSARRARHVSPKMIVAATENRKPSLRKFAPDSIAFVSLRGRTCLGDSPRSLTRRFISALCNHCAIVTVRFLKPSCSFACCLIFVAIGFESVRRKSEAIFRLAILYV